ncbi:MAG: MBL fold metallo-hydrolase [Longimicrobiaceae bacterium]
MILKRFYDDKLAQASYLIGSSESGEALIVDANRDVEQYVRAAEAEGLRITHVTETHIHADYLSGSRELAARTGARLYLSAEGGEEWRYSFAEEDDAVLLHDGDSFRVGTARIDVLHTPGHTPEHLIFLVTETTGADRPMGATTGDFIFVGDVGRPDLLEKAARVEGTMESAARTLYRSLQRISEQPDYLLLWPGHGAGSACGKAMSALPHSTLGYESIFNWAFNVEDEEEFVRMVLAGQPEPPKYFAEMKRMNRDGPRVLGGFPCPERLPAGRLGELLEEGALVIDTRPAADFGAAHVPGTITIPLNRSFNTWAGWLVPYDREFYLILDGTEDAQVEEVVRDLAMIGLDRVGGYFAADAMESWATEGGSLETIAQIGSAELAARLERGEVEVLDVRGRAEWEAGHLPGVENIPVGYLRDRTEEIPAGRPLVLHCQGGARSAIAASVLQAAGVKEVVNYSGGFAEWQRAGREVERE